MRLTAFVSLLGFLGASAAAQPQPLGIFGMWGAFLDETRCYAIAQPYRAPPTEGWRPFAAIGHWPNRSAGQLHVRLSREKRARSAVLLRVDDRTFQLLGRGRDAWAPNARADTEIRAAMRTGVEMVVSTRSVGGMSIREHYQLRGAATAMDAAALACIGRS